jgi:hypothetical protein
VQKTVEQVEEVFDEDTLFHEQRFAYTNKGRGIKGMYHVIKEIEHRENKADRLIFLCGNSTTISKTQSLTERIQNTRKDHPRQLLTCGKGRQVFESRTGRKPRRDMEKYDGGGRVDAK